MTGIHKDMFDALVGIDRQNRLGVYGISVDDIKTLFEAGTPEERSRQAKSLFQQVIRSLHNDAMEKYYDQLEQYENAFQWIIDYHRDHTVHILLCYILGICINEKVLADDARHVPPVKWVIACLFHDIGYPVELIYNSFIKVKQDYGWSPDLHLQTLTRKIFDKKSPIGILSDCYKRWHLRFRARTEYQFVVEKKRMCHGMISAITVLEKLAAIYENLGYEDEYRSQVVPACAAIFLHNLNRARYDEEAKKLTGAHGSQVALLLKVVDGFQDWWRPSATHRDGYEPDNYRLQLQTNLCRFIVLDADRFKKISEEHGQCVAYDRIIVANT